MCEGYKYIKITNILFSNNLGKIKVEYLARRPGDYAEVYSDPSKINKELNWTAKYTDLEESLRVAWRWQKAHRNGYGTTPLAMAA